ncbi:MAG: WecB/TagA/CpsF family glycosyltransferase, partial [Desulfitobacteriaceae bacterium]|nr:WecB/TagA/CpsF family glycosyltransferase [Desulfitobacteriaceae bacterium]
TETVAYIRQAIREQRYIRVVTANPEMIYAAQHDQGLAELINSAEIVTADGIGVVWAVRKLGSSIKERVTGIDLVQALLPIAHSDKWRVFFLGGKPGVAESAAQKVSKDYPGLIWQAYHGYFQPPEEEQLLRRIKDFRPDLLLVGMGIPKQEYWIYTHQGLAAVSIGVGGSFDVLAGLVLRAPNWIRNWHLEWLYRIWREPWRWRRQLVLPRFVWQVFICVRKKKDAEKYLDYQKVEISKKWRPNSYCIISCVFLFFVTRSYPVILN